MWKISKKYDMIIMKGFYEKYRNNKATSKEK